MEKQWKQLHTLFFGGRGKGSKITADGDCSHEIKRRLPLRRKVMSNLDSILKSRDIILPTNVCLVKVNDFSNSHVWIWELDYKESWVPKNWCFWAMVLEGTPESPMDCSLPGSSVHEIFQARVLEWVAISFSRGSSQPRDQTHFSCIGSRRFTIWDTREVSRVFSNESALYIR